MSSTELLEFTERQFPIDANILHTFGQLLAIVAPLIAIQALGILSILSGAVLVSFVNNMFSNSEKITLTSANEGFGLVSGGAFATITNQFQNSLRAGRLQFASLNDESSASSSSESTACVTNCYKAVDGLFTGQSYSLK